jgi:hypothetical protein
MKEPSDFQLKEYRNMEKIDLLAYLIANDYQTDKEELKYSKINTNQAAEFARVLLLSPILIQNSMSSRSSTLIVLILELATKASNNLLMVFSVNCASYS